MEVGCQEVLSGGRCDDRNVSEPSRIADPDIQIAFEGDWVSLTICFVCFDPDRAGHVTSNGVVWHNGLVLFSRPLAHGTSGWFRCAHDTKLTFVQQWLEHMIHVWYVISSVQSAPQEVDLFVSRCTVSIKQKTVSIGCLRWQQEHVTFFVWKAQALL